MEKNLYLSRRELLALENELVEDIALFIPSEASSLYFPTNDEPAEAVYLADEEKLLLPLRMKDKSLLAVYLARKPSKEAVEKLLPHMSSILEIILEKLILKKAIRLDRTTELYTRHSLIQSLAHKIQHFREDFSDYAEKPTGRTHSSTCLGILYLRFADMPAIAKRFNPLFAEECMHSLSQLILEDLPYEGMVARVNTYDCALLLSDELIENRPNLNDYIHNLCLKLSSLNFPVPRPHLHRNIDRISCSVHSGYILFPQDCDFLTAEQDARELAYTLLLKAQFAADKAFEYKKSYISFNQLIHENARIQALLPHNKFAVNLGRNVGLREGMLFSVYGQVQNEHSSFAEQQRGYKGRYKGELHLLEIFEEYAIAEQRLLHDQAYTFEENDMLIKLPSDYTTSQESHKPRQKQGQAQLYKYTDFLDIFNELRLKHKEFFLTILQIKEHQEDNIPMESMLSQAAQLFRQQMCEPFNFIEDEDYVLASYGQNSLLAFLPLISLDNKFNSRKCFDAYEKLSTLFFEQSQHTIAIGIAEHPFLHYKAIDTLENCKKALECAKLLDFPHVSFCDSISLNISADKFAAQGLLYEALQEYQYALLADPTNALAQNSLGVTLVSLNRHSEAQQAFKKALELTPDDVSIHYNLGSICQNLNEIDEAKVHFEKCLNSDEYAYYAHLKLGQIAEAQDQQEKARAYYTEAISNNPTKAGPYKQLAQISLTEGDTIQAREHLHTALRFAPHDKDSLLILAKLYLTNNEDPALAASILSPLISHTQKSKEVWEVYIQALQAQGKTREAELASKRMNNL